MSDQEGLNEGGSEPLLKHSVNRLVPKESFEPMQWGALATPASSLGPSDRPLSETGAEGEDVGQAETSPLDIEGDMTDPAAHVSAAPLSDEQETKVASTPMLTGDGSEESFEETVRLLATRSPLAYEQVRKGEAKRLGVRTSILDQAVQEAKSTREAVDTSDSFGQTIEPWHESVNAAQVLDALLATIKTYIACGEATSVQATLFIAFTWFIDFFLIAPIAVITSPMKRCGKSIFLELIGKLCRRPLLASHVTAASIFQTIAAYQPTLLIDETDSFMKKNEQIRGVINSGHTRATGYVFRAGQKDEIPRKYPTFCAKALCGIGELPDTIMDRAVVLKCRRKHQGEHVQRLRHADPDHFTTMTRKLARLALDNGPAIRSARPLLPESLNDRAQDNWEPLLAIAELAGEEWAQRARDAAMSPTSEDEESDISVMLLLDIQRVFGGIPYEKIGGKPVKRIQTKNLLLKLAIDDSRPWATNNHGSPMTAKQLADNLDPFGIKPANDKWPEGKVLKGFRLEQFEDAFSRYLPVLADAEGDQGHEEDAEAHPSSRYPATCMIPCGSSGPGSIEVAGADALLPEGEVAGVATGTATCDLPSASEPASALESSGVAAESDLPSNDAGADNPGVQILAGEALASTPLPRRGPGRPRKVRPESPQDASALIHPEQNHGAGIAAEVPSPTYFQEKL